VQRQGDGKFLCPCHGALYDAEGRVVAGPANRDLPRFQIAQRTEDEVQLVGRQASVPLQTAGETIKADYYVFATDVPGVQQLFKLCEGEVNQLVHSQVEKLAIADPFAVARFWFDRDFDWNTATSRLCLAINSLTALPCITDSRPIHRLESENWR
jgi:isorenieratene synthase